MTRNEGGCLCGAIRYATLGLPDRVTFCHCRFCQKATGSAYMVEPIFNRDALTLLAGRPKVFELISKGSGKAVRIHFCADCGSKLWLGFERFPNVVGVYAGSFDDPCWFPVDPASSKHIFLGVARADSIIPAGLPTYLEHAATMDGVAHEASVFAAHHQIGS